MLKEKTLCVCAQDVRQAATVLCVCAQDVQGGERDFESIKQALLDWDLSLPKRYMVDNGIYAAAEIDAVELEYKRFLALALAYPAKRIPIALKIDNFWHTHILFTQDYCDMGKTLIGGYIHHRPGILDDRAELGSCFEAETLPLYRKHFGEPDMSFWNPANQEIGTLRTGQRVA